MKLSNYCKLIVICCLLTLWSSDAAAYNSHRFHTSLTRIEYIAKQQTNEITIQLFTHDLVLILEKRGGKRVELEKTSDADRLIFDYLKQHFVLTDKNGAVKSLKWIGKEIDTDSVRIYLEAPATENLENYKLRNTIFLDDFPEQTNLVVCRYDGKKADLLFKNGDKIKEITENKTAAEN